MRLKLNKHEQALPGSIIIANGRTWLSQIDLTRTNTFTTIESKLIKLEPVLEPGVGMTLQLLVYTGKKEIQRVYLCPSWYIASVEGRRFKTGDEVTVSGSQVALKNEPPVIATTVKWRNEILQLRNNDGIPVWVGWRKKSD